MDCIACNAPSKRFGKDRKGNQRHRCLTCGKTFAERPERLLGDMIVPEDRALLCLSLLCEGSSIRAIERVTGTEKKTILRLLCQVGEGCELMLEETVKAVPVKDVQADELWTFVHCKQGTRERNKIADPDAGDAYCYIGMERHSKLVLAWHLGRRNRWDCVGALLRLLQLLPHAQEHPHDSGHVGGDRPEAVEHDGPGEGCDGREPHGGSSCRLTCSAPSGNEPRAPLLPQVAEQLKKAPLPCSDSRMVFLASKTLCSGSKVSFLAAKVLILGS
jgi:transposase-like protein